MGGEGEGHYCSQRNKEDIVAIKQEQHGNLKKNIQKTMKNKFEW